MATPKSSFPDPISLLEKVRRELAQYDHPLFSLEAHDVSEGIEISIRLRAVGVDVHSYSYQLKPREIESTQFPWIFQKQLYDCLHDYVIEMFVCNPQREC